MAAVLPDDIDTADLATRLRPAMLRLSRLLRREALKIGISTVDAQILGVVKKNPGAGISELAAIEQVSRPAMSVHVKRLEAQGWLTRDAQGDSADRRRAPLLLSAKGQQALAAIRRSRDDWLAARLDRLDAAEVRAVAAAVEPLLRLAEMIL